MDTASTLDPSGGGQSASRAGQPSPPRPETPAARKQRRQAWGREWGAVNRYNAEKLRGHAA